MNVETEDLQDDSSSDVENSDNEEETQDDSDEEMQSDEADDELDENQSEGDDEDEGNAGWADAFAKTLQQQKPKNKKYLVLSKAKKLTDQKDQSDSDKKLTFEIDDDGQEEKEDAKPVINAEDQKPTNNELELAMIERKERNNKLQQLRVKPASMDRERERSFKRIATKGVVQLFNAVRSQQRDLVNRLEKAGPLDHKRDEVLNNINKKQFLDMLMGGKQAKSENIDNAVKNEKNPQDGESKPSQWSVLRDDFMTSKKLKHWDQEDDDENSGNAINDDDMDSD